MISSSDWFNNELLDQFIECYSYTHLKCLFESGIPLFIIILAKLIDFGKAHTLTSATINQINELRSGKEFSRLLVEITEFCVENNIDLSVNVNKTTISTRFKNCSVTSTIGQCEEIDNESEYTDFDFYPLSNEIQELKPMLKQSKSKDIGDLSFEVLPLDQAFSKIIYLAISALTIPMFSTTTERAFSK
ncbi:unnamed protein product [Rotaria socialis]|uniref:HAT C-terminal dimerisation domain-containing protein n=1 Tax=Rotaria socialis TaxID=392032 RepID=A0A821DMQ7_9BILA|nr:unnamed protein product [Rotaria socialis]